MKFTEPTPYLEIESKGLVHKPCDENTERDDANRNLERPGTVIGIKHACCCQLRINNKKQTCVDEPIATPRLMSILFL